METSKKFLHDRLMLLLVTLVSLLLVIGVLSVLIRFDVSKNPTTIIAWRPNVSGSSYQSGRPIDIYSLAIFMVLSAVAGVFLAFRTYKIQRSISVFMLSATNFILLLSVIVANALISLQ